MTVAVGMVCSDGVLIATDSQATSDRVAQPAAKAKAFSGAATVWCGAGSQYVIEEVGSALVSEVEHHLLDVGDNEWKRVFREPNVDAIRSSLAAVVRQTMKSCYQTVLPVVSPPGAPVLRRHPFDTDFLFAGMAGDTKFLLEISGDGQLNWHTARGFHALGTGGEFATVIMETMKPHLDDSPPDLQLGKIVAYRTIDTTCAVSADLSGPVQMAVADSSGSRVLDEDELQAMEKSVQSWKASERSLLRSLSDGSGT